MPPPLPQFALERSGLDYDSGQEEIYLYHGTNCYRRWEINRSGAIEPGRSNYSFFCTRAADAYRYARAASMRDMSPGAVNSLICEPVVLKVRFNVRTWMQVDFIQEIGFVEEEENASLGLTMAVLGPVQFAAIVDILHCSHGRRLGCASESIRTFDDGTLMEGIRHLREKLCKKRADAWVLKKLGIFTQQVGTKLLGGEMPELTLEDNLRRLRQSQVRA
ncbi:MAG: hypothetical protein JST89_05595 [Cyanobacteria bacterium SZAS-4]|nr:hypothetical protein [Cyanobacteria bacterium SZAS-4]